MPGFPRPLPPPLSALGERCSRPDFTNSRQVNYSDALASPDEVPSALFELFRSDGSLMRFDPRRLREAAGMVRHVFSCWLKRIPRCGSTMAKIAWPGCFLAIGTLDGLRSFRGWSLWHCPTAEYECGLHGRWRHAESSRPSPDIS